MPAESGFHWNGRNLPVKVKRLLVATRLHQLLALSHPEGALQENVSCQTLGI